MSRLDDELRRAYRREQPSVDFASRLLERVAAQPAPKESWLRRLAAFLDPPKLRLVAIGVTASLLLAIGAAQYSRLNSGTIKDDGKVAKNDPAPETSGAAALNTKDHSPQDAATTTAKPAQHIKRVAHPSTNHRAAPARRQEDTELRAEGEAAKEKLMLALSIASSALNDAQKAVHDDGLKP